MGDWRFCQKPILRHLFLTLTFILILANAAHADDASGTTSPNATQITDSNGTAWTLDGNGNSYENGNADGGSQIALLLFYKGNVYAQTTDLNWWENTGTGWLSVGGDPRGGGLRPSGGVAPPAGMHWQTTFDDEFTQDSTIRTDLWNGYPWLNLPGDPRGDCTSCGETITVDSGGTLTTSDGTWSFGEPLYYCGSEILLNGQRAGFSCAILLLAYNGQLYAQTQNSDGTTLWTQWDATNGGHNDNDFTGVSLDPTDGLVFNPLVGGIVSTGSADLHYTKFSQRFGYWEWRMKLPHDFSGEGDGLHPTIWLWPIGLDFAPPCGADHTGEIDVTESVIGPNNQDHTFFTVHDSCDGSGDTGFRYPGQGVANLATSFHTYGFYWYNDGTPQGSVQPYFDGVPQGSPVTINFSTAWQNGAYVLMAMDPCAPAFNDGVTCDSNTDHTNNPWSVQYMRVWQAVPN